MIHIRTDNPEEIRLALEGRPVRVDTDNSSVSAESAKYTTRSFAIADGILRPKIADLWNAEPMLFKIISLETIAGCNGDCGFCPVNTTSDPRPRGEKMPMAVVSEVLGQLARMQYEDTILLFGNNEPLLDDRLTDIISQARAACPRAYIKILTNGSLLTPELAVDMFEAGLSSLVINNYTDGATLTPQVQELLSHADSLVDKDVRISVRRKDDVLTTRAGLSPNKSLVGGPIRHFCAMPFVDMNVTYNGKVVLCCFDALGVSDFGKVSERSLVDIWFGKEFSDVRAALLNCDRSSNRLCMSCDFDGVRNPFQDAVRDGCHTMRPARKWLNSLYEQHVVEKTEQMVKERMREDASGHDWWHTYRVWQTALEMGRSEEVNLFVVQLAALLHDLSDYKIVGEDAASDSGIREWLASLCVDEDTVVHIAQIIAEAQFKGAKVDSPVSSIEGMVLQDADRLDAMGAIGIARAFAFGGHRGDMMHDPDCEPRLHTSFEEYKQSRSTVINHFYEKLLLIGDWMNTSTGKAVAARRHRLMVSFLEEFFREWDGSDVGMIMASNADTSIS